MCNSKIKPGRNVVDLPTITQIDGRQVLQPACNRVANLEAVRPAKKLLQKLVPCSPLSANDTSLIALRKVSSTPPHKLSPPVSPKLKPVSAVLKRGSNDPNSLNSSTEKPNTPKSTSKSAPVVRKKSKKSTTGSNIVTIPLESSLNFKNSSSYSLLSDTTTPGSIAAAQREQATLMQAQRKLRIAHYGRAQAKLQGKVVPIDSSGIVGSSQEEKRCSFITPNSDPLYVTYHDEEWGVPVHDDKMLFELMVLTGAQIGLDWTTILKKRNDFRSAFAGFDAEVVARFTERQIASISAEYGMDLGRVRGVVDNSNRILEIMREFGSLDKYLWGFVNNKPISTNYKSCRKIPVKTSKSESISKDMVRRGFRFVGPTVLLSFMQAAGLTNDHLLNCPRHHQLISPHP